MTEQITSTQIKNWLLLFAERINEHQDYLNELDAELGDADHGTHLQRATEILRQRLVETDLVLTKRSPKEILRIIGIVLLNHISGAAGPLYGAFFLNAANSLDTTNSVDDISTVNRTKAVTQAIDEYTQIGDAESGAANRSASPLLTELTSLFAHGLKGIQQRGRVKGGEKTMADTLIPAVQSLQNSSLAALSIHDAMTEARAFALQGMQQTIEQKSLKGRASYLGLDSIGHQDSGATGIYILFETAAEIFGQIEQTPFPVSQYQNN